MARCLAKVQVRRGISSAAGVKQGSEGYKRAKMRLPKKVRINNRPWEVCKNNKESISTFNYRKMKINIGTLCNSDRELLNGFMHEVAEISAVERGIRSQKSMLQHEANDYVFTASHKQFSDMLSDISSIIGDIMKLE